MAREHTEASAADRQRSQSPRGNSLCVPGMYRQSGGKKLPASSMGARLDKAQRDATANYGGGSAPRNGVQTTLMGTPRNTEVAAIRKNTLLEV